MLDMIRGKLRSGTRLALVVGSFALLFWLIGCSGGEPQSSTGPGTARDLCSLNAAGDSFRCLMVMPGASARCGESIAPEIYADFLDRMTRVSIESLYLDGERGAEPPYRYRSPGGVIAAVQVQDCQVVTGSCGCIFEYSYPALKEIFYDSAGCRMSSRYSNHPLYFRGRGC